MRCFPSLVALFAACASALAVAAPEGAALFELVQQYERLGVHRTGTEVDHHTSEWFAEQLRARGAQVAFETFSVPRFDARVRLSADGAALPAEPLFYAATGALEDDQPAVAELPVTEKDGASEALRAAIERARAEGARSLVVATQNPLGELQLPNVDPAHGFGLPVVLVAGRSAAQLHGRLHLSWQAEVSAAVAQNVVARFGDTGRSPIVIATPLSCWFGCAAERGTGIALALALAEHLAGRHPVVVLGTPGHELLPHVGLQAWLKAHPETPGLVVHLGANLALGQRGPDGRLEWASARGAGLRMPAAVAQKVAAALQPLHVTPKLNPPQWFGEGALWAQASSAPMMSFVGIGPAFHTPVDTAASTTSPALLAQAQQALDDAVDAWLKAMPMAWLAGLKPQVRPVSAAQAGAAAGTLPHDCFWSAVIGAKQLNVLYPDEGALYWATQLRLPQGARLSFDGRFPRARYMSFNAYDAEGQPVDRLADVQLRPVGGGENPFAVGALRRQPKAYRLQVEEADVVAGRPVDEAQCAPDTLYAPRSGVLSLLYRVYLPDHGQDATGGAGLPRAQLTLADGHRLDGEALCRAVVQPEGAVRDLVVPGAPLKALFDTLPNRAAHAPAQPQPRWNAFFNPLLALSSVFLGTPFEPLRQQLDATRRGGFFGTLDNLYLSMYVDDRYGDLLVLRGQAPRTPHTEAGPARMPDAELRYWSLCKYRSLADTAVDACLHDEQVPLDAQGRFTIVVSTPEQRPANARAECGVAWLPWGTGDGLGNPHGGFLLWRQMMPSAAFRPHSAFATQRPGDEAAVLGPYYPQPAYEARSVFEATGCAASVPSRIARTPERH
jgi:hypothetical protein